MSIRLVYISAPRSDADSIARALVEKRVAACVNLVQQVSSIYRWQGAIETADETMLVAKTTAAKSAELLALVEELHPYDVPECIFVDVADGLPSYLKWVEEEVS